MHSPSWQAACGFLTDAYDTLNRENVTLRNIFEEICSHGNVHYALWTEKGKKLRYTYGELPFKCAAAACKIDQLIPEKTGVVALHMANGPMWPVLFWALLMSGHTPLLLNAAMPLSAFAPVLQHARAVAAISCENAENAIHPNSLLDTAPQADMALFEGRWEDKVIFLTSGTSGTPKLLVYNGNCFAGQIRSCRYFYRETEHLAYPKSNGALRQLALLPFSHIFGFVICVMWYSFFGKQIVYPQSIRPDDVIAACRNWHVTHLCAVPGYFDIMAQIMVKAAKGMLGKKADDFIHYLKTGQLPQPQLYQRYTAYAHKLCSYILGGDMRYIISGGGMLSLTTAAFFNRLGLYFCNGYGMTELGILCVEREAQPEKRMQASVGSPSYGVQFTLDDDGQLLVNCDFAAIGYLDGENIVPLQKPFPTKDMARMLPDGRYMLIGRCDDIVIDANGNRWHPNEVEERLRGIPGVTGICVISSGKKLIALAEMAPEQNVQPVAQAIERANRNLPLSLCVYEAWACARLPRTSKGETDRKKAAAEYEQGLQNARQVPMISPTVIAQPAQNLVKEIQCKVAELLNVPEQDIVPTANFFSELGMDSLAYMCLAQWLEEKYRVPCTLPDQRRFETVFQCVEYIQNKGE